MLSFVILSTLIFLLLPSVAQAWGPGTHIELALALLEKVALFAPAVRAAIAGREDWFIYGNVAADIVVAKRLAGVQGHCHNWKVAQAILKNASTDEERAAAYGYLSHIAVDIVAHNYFVPFKIVKSYKTRLLSHTYWEMRFDMHVRPLVWTKMREMTSGRFKAFDRLLSKVLKRALFSFGTSKKIFIGILAIQRLSQIRKTFNAHAKRSRYGLDTEGISHYMRLAVKTAMGCLADPDNAPCLSGDPVGDYKIEYAKMMRWALKQSLKGRVLTRRDVDRGLELVREELQKNIFVPRAALPNLHDICFFSSQRR
jgi:hypothetical protein